MHGAKKDEKSGAHHVFVASCIVGSLFYVSWGWGLRCKSNTRIKNENRRKRRPAFTYGGGTQTYITVSARGRFMFVLHDT